jgi:hypothetical protein
MTNETRNNAGVIQALELLRAVVTPAGYNRHARYLPGYLPGTGFCQKCFERVEHDVDLDVWFAAQTYTLEKHEDRRLGPDRRRG